MRVYNLLHACLLADLSHVFRIADIPFESLLRLLPPEVSELIRKVTDGAADADADLIRMSSMLADGADKKQDWDAVAQESIFNYVRDGGDSLFYLADSSALEYPRQTIQNAREGYRSAVERFIQSAEGQSFDEAHLNQLLDLLKNCFRYIPMPYARRDVSLYHHAKTAAALCACLLLQTTQGKGVDVNAPAFMETPHFALYSIDLSGIQAFIYSISNKGALKGMRTRSFYLGLLMEHIADSILEACGLSRANLIYCGGGKAHLLLPNCEALLYEADRMIEQCNRFLREHFGAALFVAAGRACATANELCSDHGTSDAFSALFREVSMRISERKLRRYDPVQLQALNAREADSADRECAVCGSTNGLRPREEDWLCEACHQFERFSRELAADAVLMITQDRMEPYLPLPFGEDTCLVCVSRDQAQTVGEYLRCYSVNHTIALPRSITLPVGNYQPASDEPVTFEALAARSVGIRRLGVLRADVDDLGALFARGFVQPGTEKPYRYLSMARYSALSMAMTDFFQQEINRIVASGVAPRQLPEHAANGRHVAIVYAGGDDVFLVGAWNEVLNAGLALRHAFSRYTGGRVLLSGGVGVYPEKTPVRMMAEHSAELEQRAKRLSGKAAVSLFDEDGVFTFHWSELEQTVLGEMLPLLETVLRKDANGNALLYRVLALLRQITGDAINVARLAYLLSRHTPDVRSGATASERSAFERFTKQIYTWALSEEQNRKLQAAILLYLYEHREEMKE